MSYFKRRSSWRAPLEADIFQRWFVTWKIMFAKVEATSLGQLLCPKRIEKSDFATGQACARAQTSYYSQGGKAAAGQALPALKPSRPTPPNFDDNTALRLNGLEHGCLNQHPIL